MSSYARRSRISTVNAIEIQTDTILTAHERKRRDQRLTARFSAVIVFDIRSQITISISTNQDTYIYNIGWRIKKWTISFRCLNVYTTHMPTEKF